MSLAIELDPAIFDHFTPHAGRVPSGFWINWLGVLTRANVWAFTDDVRAIYDKERYERTAYPLHDEHVLDWIPLLEAVLASDSNFSMAAAGAGWGRWLSGGAFAAIQTGRTYTVMGVEAEPEHFNWMVNHFQDNHLDPARCRLVEAVAAERSGFCWFWNGDSAAWYGQAMVPERDVSPPTPESLAPGTILPYGNHHIKRTPCIGLDRILEGRKVDYLHMDIQGTELEFVTAFPDLLHERVRMVNIGTHSHEVEAGLRSFFTRLGWKARFDIPMNGEVQVKLGSKPASAVKFGDGVQVWVRV